MKLINTTDWPDYFLRRMVAWCCRQSGLPVKALRCAQFRNRSTGYSGHAYGGRRIVCSIGLGGFPTRADVRPGMDDEIFADRMECLVAITAHEVEHVCQYTELRIGSLARRRATERVTRAHEVKVLRLFRADREALLAQWSHEIATDKPRLSRQQQNDAKARKMLATWERKLKLAKTKVSAYRRKVRYYDRIAAKRSNP